MAATAEALMNTLAGGSDGDLAGGSSGNTAQDHHESGGHSAGPDRPAQGGHVDNGNQVGGQPDRGGPLADQRADHQVAGSDSAGNDNGAGNRSADQVTNLHAAIRETRAENKTLKQQLAELTAKIDSLSKPAQPKEEAPAEPDFLADPKGYVDDAKAKLKQLTDQIEADKAKQTETQKQQQAAQETWNKVIASEQEFAAATPDYYDAINHVRGIRAEQIKVEIRETEEREPTAEEIGRILSIQEAQGAAALIAKGKNPSKFYYEYAKTFGYRPKAATTTAPPAAKPDKDAVRTMGSGGGAEHVAADEPEGALGILAAAQNEHKAQFKRRK